MKKNVANNNLFSAQTQNKYHNRLWALLRLAVANEPQVGRRCFVFSFFFFILHRAMLYTFYYKLLLLFFFCCLLPNFGSHKRAHRLLIACHLAVCWLQRVGPFRDRLSLFFGALWNGTHNTTTATTKKMNHFVQFWCGCRTIRAHCSPLCAAWRLGWIHQFENVYHISSTYEFRSCFFVFYGVVCLFVVYYLSQ